MKHLIGKQFELQEVDLFSSSKVLGVTLVGDDEVLRLEADTDGGNSNTSAFIAASIESLVEPAPGNEVLRDVHCGTFLAAER